MTDAGPEAPAPSSSLPDPVRALAGIVAGAVCGYVVFRFLAKNGLYAPMVPGALVGMGCGMWVKTRSHARAVICVLVATFVNAWSEWMHFPFVINESFSYFITHLQDLTSRTQLMYGVSAVIAYYFAYARQNPAAKEE